MRRKRCKRAYAGSSCALMIAAASVASADPQYNILDLGTLGTSSYAYDINNSGQIVGDSLMSDGYLHAYRTAANTPINPATDNLGTVPGGFSSSAYAINSSATVAGISKTALGTRAFRHSGSTMTDIGTLDANTWAYAYAINDSGQVVGGSSVSSNSHAFLYSGNRMYDLGTLGGTTANMFSWGWSINSAGMVVGYSRYDPISYWQEHAFLWTPTRANGTSGTMTDLGTLGGNYSYAWSINSKNRIVGASLLAGDIDYHALRWTGATKLDLGTLGGTYSEAFDINLSGDMVGAADVGPGGPTDAFVFTNGMMYDLNALIPAGSGWVLQSARAVNDSGQIVGYGSNPAGETHAFLLTPLTHSSGWKVDAGGNWSSSANWSNGVPVGGNAAASFGDAITAPRTITVDTPYTVGAISFDSANAYTLTGAAGVTMSASFGNASIAALVGSHTITTPLVLQSNTVAYVHSTSAGLALSGGLSGSGALIKTGPGTLVLSGVNSHGGTYVNGGILSLGSGASLGAAGAAVGVSGGTLQLTGNISAGQHPIIAGSAGGTINMGTFAATFGAIGGGDLTKTGAGTMTIHLSATSMAPSIDAGVLMVQSGTIAIEARSTAPPIASNNHPVYLKGLDLGPAGPTYVSGNFAPGSEVGALDLKDHDLVMDYSATGISPFTTLYKYVIDGQVMGGSTGILSNTTHALGGNLLVLIDNVDFGLTEWPLGSGHTIASQSVIGKYTFLGDTNLDGRVTAEDYAPVDTALAGGGIYAGATYLTGDMDFNGTVDAQDYSPLDQNVLVSVPDNPYAPTTIPEPGVAAFGLLDLGFWIVLRERKRRGARA
jgi:probable HAF family extracellular repeat protein/autotransporter-associated beta strand protein